MREDCPPASVNIVSACARYDSCLLRSTADQEQERERKKKEKAEDDDEPEGICGSGQVGTSGQIPPMWRVEVTWRNMKNRRKTWKYQSQTVDSLNERLRHLFGY